MADPPQCNVLLVGAIGVGEDVFHIKSYSSFNSLEKSFNVSMKLFSIPKMIEYCRSILEEIISNRCEKSWIEMFRPMFRPSRIDRTSAWDCFIFSL